MKVYFKNLKFTKEKVSTRHTSIKNIKQICRFTSESNTICAGFS